MDLARLVYGLVERTEEAKEPGSRDRKGKFDWFGSAWFLRYQPSLPDAGNVMLIGIPGDT